VQSLISAYSERHPAQPWPLYFLGQLASQMGEATGHRADLERAGVLLRKSVALDSNYAEAHFELGNVYSRLSQWRDAAEEYRKAIKLKQSMPEAHYRLATVYRHLGNSASARSELQAHQRLTQAESTRSQRDQDVQVFLFKLARQD
jgi:tetratricopeptide (TPR) repeat protein